MHKLGAQKQEQWAVSVSKRNEIVFYSQATSRWRFQKVGSKLNQHYD
ncbi:hypothetical protein ACMAZF_02165 [Psychrobium sp. nBUS_13]